VEQRQRHENRGSTGGTGRDWTKVAAWAAVAGVVLNFALGYAALASSRNLWPFQAKCSVIVNTVPNSVDRATAGADAYGSGQAYVFWQPPRCIGSNRPVVSYQVNAWLFINGHPKYIRTQTVPGTSRSMIFTGLINGDFYDFGIIAVNLIGSSSPTFTNQVVPPRKTSA
jgi:hypothetical protein